jgi:hypothetical protein
MFRLIVSAVTILSIFVQSWAFQSVSTSRATSYILVPRSSISDDEGAEGVQNLIERRSIVASGVSLLSSCFFWSRPAHAEGKSFAPGGTLVEYEVGVQVGNSLASKSRKADNSNVVFSQDYYYKFGTAAPWIDTGTGSMEFPKTMPFVPTQQRYEAMKKYRERVQRGVDLVVNLKNAIEDGSFRDVADGSAPEYSIRPMGLLANNLLASENTGTTNELLLSRWYINEIFLDINDVQSAASKEQALQSYEAALKALNSYLGLLNRVITPKVGDKWDLV